MRLLNVSLVIDLRRKDCELLKNYEDYLRFYIDNQFQGGWSGEQDWSLQQYAITSGPRTLRWIYQKDASISSGSDCAWIDKITVTGVMP